MSDLPIIVAFLMGVWSGYFIGRYLKENDLDIMRIRNRNAKLKSYPFCEVKP